MATGRIGTTPVLQVRWSKAPSAGTTSLSGLDDNSVSLVYSVGYEAVYRNGVLLSRTNDYTATDGTTITLIDATIAGDIIEVFANQTIPLADTYSQTVANGKFINNTLTTTTGDIIYASAANTPARLGIGSTSQVLTVSGGVPAWATASSGGYTELASGTASGATLDLTSISGSYRNLVLIWRNVRPSSNGEQLLMRFNSDTTASRHAQTEANAVDAVTFNGTTFSTDPGTNSGATNANSIKVITVYDYANTSTYKFAEVISINVDETTNTLVDFRRRVGIYNQTGAITALNFLWTGSVNFGGGTYVLYGVK